MKSKTFKTLDEQVEILREKGLIINDYKKTKELLFRENYFFISGYRHLFMQSSNYLSKKYGCKEKDYLNPINFTQDSLRSRQVHDVLNKIKRQVRVNGRQHTATMHYIDHYGYIPMWILVKVLSFGIVSEL